MKNLILLLLFFTLSMAYSQGKRIESYTASNGITYQEDDVIELNLGSGADGDFVYLKIGGWAAGTDTQIGSAYSGLAVNIKKIKRQKFKGVERIVFTVGGGNITNYLLMIEEAIASCEIKPCASNESAVVQSDKYDQLAKLKKLLDDGVISESEFESEKAKILN